MRILYEFLAGFGERQAAVASATGPADDIIPVSGIGFERKSIPVLWGHFAMQGIRQAPEAGGIDQADQVVVLAVGQGIGSLVIGKGVFAWIRGFFK